MRPKKKDLHKKQLDKRLVGLATNHWGVQKLEEDMNNCCSREMEKFLFDFHFAADREFARIEFGRAFEL